jgi:hypothetical protein
MYAESLSKACRSVDVQSATVSLRQDTETGDFVTLFVTICGRIHDIMHWLIRVSISGLVDEASQVIYQLCGRE